MISALIAVLALAAVQPGHAATVGDLVNGITQSCPDAAAAFAAPDFSILQTLVLAAADVQVPDVAGKKEVVIAPTNAAFEELLASAGMTAEQFMASELFQPTLLAHIGVATNNGASTAQTLTNSLLRFYQGDDTAVKLPLMQIADGVSQVQATVQGPMNKVPISTVINCGGNKYIMVSGSVVKPKAAGSSKAPAAAPMTDVPAVLTPMEPVVTMPVEPIVQPEVAPVELPVAISPIPAVPEVPVVPDIPAPVETPVVMPPVASIVSTSAASSIKAIAASCAAVVAAAFM